ncbi:MAG: hypothetical protein K0Q72_3674 [Armatimonadetes bacterium]|jgi:hypothetical protein|nr:hypothetical protein [Armatimonadota bacterium]
MLKQTVLTFMAAGALGATAFAADVTSGLQPGDKATVFQVVDVSGPNKGKQLCYR